MIEHLTLETWDRMTPAERETLARRLAGELPNGFALRGLEPHALGGQKRWIAEYEFEGATFALLPGARVTLGFDAERDWTPTAEELASWQDTADEYGIEHSLKEHVALATLRPRTVELRPLLMETAAGEVGWRPVPLDDPEVQEMKRRYFDTNPLQGQVEAVQSDYCLRVWRDEDGSLKAQRSDAQTHEQLAAPLAKAGFRFPTSDEWEFACGAGSPSLFRWGDHVPCDRYPTDVSPEEAAWRKEWVLSGGTLEPPAEGFAPDWSLHRCPSALGVSIASDPYKFELTCDPEITRGGDGGGMICGGAGFWIGWLTLATAYFEDHACRREASDPISIGFTIGRRVLPLA